MLRVSELVFMICGKVPVKKEDIQTEEVLKFPNLFKVTVKNNFKLFKIYI